MSISINKYNTAVASGAPCSRRAAYLTANMNIHITQQINNGRVPSRLLFDRILGTPKFLYCFTKAYFMKNTIMCQFLWWSEKFTFSILTFIHYRRGTPLFYGLMYFICWSIKSVIIVSNFINIYAIVSAWYVYKGVDWHKYNDMTDMTENDRYKIKRKYFWYMCTLIKKN